MMVHPLSEYSAIDLNNLTVIEKNSTEATQVPQTERSRSSRTSHKAEFSSECYNIYIEIKVTEFSVSLIIVQRLYKLPITVDLHFLGTELPFKR
jgi:hypothetical protein